MAHIQIPQVDPIISYTVGGTPQTVFAVPFPFFADSDLVVTVGGNLKTLTTDYTVTGHGETSGGTLTFGTGVSNAEVVIERVLPISRVTDFPDTGPFRFDDLNTELDRIIAIVQQVDVGMGGFEERIQQAVDLLESLLHTETGTTQYNTRTAAAAATIGVGVTYLRTAGYAAVGDGGDSLYKRATSEPAHPGKFQSVDRYLPDGTTHSTNGGWWELVCQDYVLGEQLGMSSASSNNAPALQNCIDFATAKNVRVKLGRAEYHVTSGVTISAPITIEGTSPGVGPLTFTTAGTAIYTPIGFLTGDIITINTFFQVIIRNIRFDSEDYRTSGAAIRLNAVTATQQSTQIDNCIFWRQYDCIYGSDAGATLIRDCMLAYFLHAGGRFDSLRGVEASGGTWQNCTIFNDAAGSIGEFGIYLAAGYAVIEGCGIQGHNYGIFIDAKPGATGDIKIIKSSIDECRVWCVKTQENDVSFVTKIGILMIQDCEMQNVNYLFGGVGNEGFIQISPGTHVRYLKQVLISNCSFNSNNIGPLSNAIRIEDSLDTFVTGCKLNNNGAFGGGSTSNAPRAFYVGALATNVHLSNNEILGYERPGPIIFDGAARLTHFGPLTLANLPPANVVSGSHAFVSDGRATDATNTVVIGAGSGVPAWYYYGSWRTPANVF